MKSLSKGTYQFHQNDLLEKNQCVKVYKGIIAKQKREVTIRLLSFKQNIDAKPAIESEVEKLKKLSDKDNFFTNICDCFIEGDNAVMIQEIGSYWNLQDVVLKRGPLPEYEVIEIAYQIVRGIQYISERNVVHGDIKSANVFLRKEAGLMNYKLRGFDYVLKKQINKQKVGNSQVILPEQFEKEQNSSKIDLWAFGLLVHYLLFKDHYYKDIKEQQGKTKVKGQYQLPSQQRKAISADTFKLLKCCLSPDIPNKLSVKKMTDHRAFKSMKEKMTIIMDHFSEDQMRRRRSVQGQYLSHIMSFHFIFEVAMSLGKRQKTNLTTIYLLKYTLVQLLKLKNQVEQKYHIIHHKTWLTFTETPEFKDSFQVINNMIGNVRCAYEYYFNEVMGVLPQFYPDELQNIKRHLGHTPVSPIDPQIVIYNLQDSWLNELDTDDYIEDYLLYYEIMVVIALLRKQQVDLDFSRIEVIKKTFTMTDMAVMFGNALQS